jgi:hypothetical protein
MSFLSCFPRLKSHFNSTFFSYSHPQKSLSLSLCLHLYWRSSHFTFPSSIFFSTESVENSSTSPARRKYFYYISQQGNVYVISRNEKKMPWGPAHLRDAQFLDFFFRRLQKNDTSEYVDEFPYLSICMGEYNYIKPADKPVVFHSMIPYEEYLTSYGKRSPRSQSDNNLTPDDWVLVFGGSLFVKFSPEKLKLSQQGRLYFPDHIQGDGLLRVSIAEDLSHRFVFTENNKCIFTWKDNQYYLESQEQC